MWIGFLTLVIWFKLILLFFLVPGYCQNLRFSICSGISLNSKLAQYSLTHCLLCWVNISVLILIWFACCTLSINWCLHIEQKYLQETASLLFLLCGLNDLWIGTCWRLIIKSTLQLLPFVPICWISLTHMDCFKLCWFWLKFRKLIYLCESWKQGNWKCLIMMKITGLVIAV